MICRNGVLLLLYINVKYQQSGDHVELVMEVIDCVWLMCEWWVEGRESQHDTKFSINFGQYFSENLLHTSSKRLFHSHNYILFVEKWYKNYIADIFGIAILMWNQIGLDKI